MNWLKGFFGQIFGGNSSSEEEKEILQTEEKIEIPENNNPVDENYLFDLEEKLLRLDCGLEFAEYIVGKLREKGNLTISQAEKMVFDVCVEALQKANPENNFSENEKGLNIILIVGVNGAGKTTSIGKLAHKLVQQNKKVLIAPCDTFRAAAAEQLQKWAERAEAQIHIPSGVKRADTVLFEALQKAGSENFDCLIVDTAGRLQNKKDLMDELAKLANVISKHAPQGTNTQSLLVIDATTGQNGYQQAVSFNEATKLAGIILTKFDGSAKGGIVFAISHNLNIPIKFIGTGEKIDQFNDFKVDNFVKEVLLRKK